MSIYWFYVLEELCLLPHDGSSMLNFWQILTPSKVSKAIDIQNTGSDF